MVVEETHERVEDQAEDHNHIQVMRVSQEEQEVEADHIRMQEVNLVKMVIHNPYHPYHPFHLFHPYHPSRTSRHDMPLQTLPDSAASAQLYRQRQTP